MTPPTGSIIMDQVVTALNRRDWAALERLLADTVTDHSPSPTQQSGRDGFIAWWHSLMAQFRSLHIVGDATWVMDDYVLLRATFTLEGVTFGRWLVLVRIHADQITDVWQLMSFDRGWS